MTEPTLPPSLQKTPDLDRWIRIDEDETVTVFTGKVEIGQGIKTVIAADRGRGAGCLDGAHARDLADTLLSPDEGYTAGSTSTSTSGMAVRQAAAEVRAILVGMAAAAIGRAGRAPARGRRHGHRHGDGRNDHLLGADGRIVALSGRPPGEVKPKPTSEYTVVGTPVPRLDIPDKVVGLPVFVDDMALPGMLHARIVRPPGYAARLKNVDTGPVQAMPGVVAVMCDGSFLAVAAVREEQAVDAAQRLATLASWSDAFSPPDGAATDEAVYEHLHSATGERFLVVDGAPTDDAIPPLQAPAGAAQNAERIVLPALSAPRVTGTVFRTGAHAGRPAHDLDTQPGRLPAAPRHCPGSWNGSG